MGRIDVGFYCRKLLYDRLESVGLFYDNSRLPIVDEKLDVRITSHDVWVMFAEHRETHTLNKCKWISEVEIDVSVCSHTKSVNDKEVIENVSSQILNIMYPDNGTVWYTGLVLPLPLALTYCDYTSGDYTPFREMQGGFIAVKNLTFKMRLTQ